MEDDAGVCEHGNVDAHTAEPVVVEIDVQAHFRAGVELHQARPRQHHPETRHDLAHVLAGGQMRCGALFALEGIVVAAARRNERYRRVAGGAVRVRHPGRARQRKGLCGELRRVKAPWQADEGAAQAHGASSPTG